MAEYVVGQDGISVHRKTTVAGVVDTATFAGRRLGVEVSNFSTAPDGWLFFSVDGSDPVPDGDRTTGVPPGQAVPVEDRRRGNDTIVKLISQIPVLYSVTADAFR